MTMIPYVVQRGDHLARLAHDRGFDAETVWNASENESLRERRANPQMLAPGDILFLPAEPDPPRGLSLSPGGTRRYRAQIPRVHVRVAFRSDGRTLANEPYRIEGIAARPVTGSSDGDGNVDVEVPVDVSLFELVFTRARVRHTVRVGHLDPIGEESGLRSRLRHLGFLWPVHEMLGRPPPSPAEAAHELAFAVRAFQITRGLPATGVVDDDTRSALEEAHGA